MEVFKTYRSNRYSKEDEDMFILFSPDAVLYYGNIATGTIKWFYDLKETAYQAIQFKKGPYVDLGEDGNTLHFFTPGLDSEVIPFNSREELQSGLTTIFDKEAKTSYDEHEFFLTKDEGEKTSERGLNTFKITITDCRCWIDGRWSVRFLNAKVLSPRGDKDYEKLINVFHARSVPNFIELCDRFNVYALPGEGSLVRIINGRKKHICVGERLEIASKDPICYFNGTIGSLKVFVKRVPVGRKDLQKRVEDAYANLDRLEAVVKLMLVDRDNHFVYYAFERCDCSLDKFVKGKSVISEEIQIAISRGIAKALQLFHHQSTLHANICPEHILVKYRDGCPFFSLGEDDVFIKFCGVGLSRKLSEEEFNYGYDAEMHALGRTYLNLWKRGSYSFKDGDLTPGFINHQFNGDAELASLHSCPRDLIGKLVSHRISLKHVMEHVIFWNKKDILYFLQRLSHRISLGDFEDLDTVGSDVFTNSWIQEDSKEFKPWFMSMIHADAKDRKYEFPRPATPYWKNEADMIKSEYETTNLRDLVKIVRNSSIHRKKNTFPTKSGKEFLKFINGLYPDFVTVVYNYMSNKHKHDMADLLDKDRGEFLLMSFPLKVSRSFKVLHFYSKGRSSFLQV